MSREIKFRAWNPETKRMVDLQEITPLALSESMNSELALQGMSGLFLPFNDKWPLMQYTGLRDSKGKEIYEGDIVRLKWKDAGNHAKQTIRSVQWNGNGYGCALTEYECEVIGNIWENEDLLK